MLSIHGLTETRAAIAAGRLDPDRSVAACWERARALDPTLQAFAHLPTETPMAGHGPLAGIAVGIKDLVDTADMPTTYGSPLYRDHRPTEDAWIVARLRALGATILGKTVTTEFAWQSPGPTKNPHNHEHTPGGSSSGSAAAVAAGLVPLAIGTQTFGSVIRPAAFCGIVGYKPTFGTLPRTGVHPLSSSLDHVGLFARAVDDIAVALALLVPEARLAGALKAVLQGDAVTPRPAPRLALLSPADPIVQPAQKQAMTAAVEVLEKAGATVSALTLPADFDGVQILAETLLAYEAWQVFEPLTRRSPGGVSPALQGLLDKGAAIEKGQYVEAASRQQELRLAFGMLIQDFDAILTIPAAGEAPRGLDSTGDARFCVPWSTLGIPAITLPIAKGPAGLPLGLQLVGAWGQDAALLQVAKAAERALAAALQAP